MKIWIDADAAPREVKDIVFKAAKRLKIETIMVANQSIALPPNNSFVSMVTVSAGANVADQYIVDHCETGDVVITADVPMAADLVKKDVATIDPRGEEYHANNMASKLSMRNFMDDLRGAGTISGGGRPYNDQDKKTFAATFDRIVTRLHRRAQPRAAD